MIDADFLVALFLDAMRLGVEHTLHQHAACESEEIRDTEADRLMAILTGNRRRMIGLHAEMRKKLEAVGDTEPARYVPADSDPRPKLAPMTPEKRQGLRDAVALISAVVRSDDVGKQVILDHCDQRQTLLSMAVWAAMVTQQAAGLDQDGLLAATQTWVEDIAAITVDKGAP